MANEKGMRAVLGRVGEEVLDTKTPRERPAAGGDLVSVMRITAASLMRDMQGNAIRSEEDSCYQVFPFLIDHVRLRMIRSPRRHEHFIDRTKITFREALTEDGRRYIRHSSYPGLDDVLINAEPYTDPEFLREYAAYAFTAQLTQMSGHELAEFISSKSCDDE